MKGNKNNRLVFPVHSQYSLYQSMGDALKQSLNKKKKIFDQ